MPIFSGYETAKEIRRLTREEEIQPITVIACTGDVTPANIQKCKENFDGFLPKPV